MNSIITITGPSCSGKTYLLNYLCKEKPNYFRVLQSVTTRNPRAGEVAGEYDFITEQEFKELIEYREVLQYVNYLGNFYGTRTSHLVELLEEGVVPITVVEPTGVVQFQEALKKIGVGVFPLYLEDIEEVLMRRWLDRLIDGRTKGKDLGYLIDRMEATFTKEIYWYDKSVYKMKISGSSSLSETTNKLLERLNINPLSGADLRV